MDFSLPTVNSLWSDVIAFLKNRDLDIAKGLDPAKVTVSNPVTDMIRWNSANGYWEIYNGVSWGVHATTYNINVSNLGGSPAADYAKLASPALTGTPTGPTAAPGTNTTQLATTAFVAALGALKANLASPTFTGTPAAPTPAADDSTTKIATTAFVAGQAGTTTPVMDGTGAAGSSLKYSRADHVHPTDTSRAPLASPALTGTPTAPTPANGDNSTKIATTAFVLANNFPAGTAMLFAQTAAPTGWTKSTTHNDKALRVVSGTAGSGGTAAFSAAFASRSVTGSISVAGTVGQTTLSTAEMPAHTHNFTVYDHSSGGPKGSDTYGLYPHRGGINTNPNSTYATASQGGGGSHGHSLTITSQTFTGNAMDFAVQYVDVIIATKN